MGGNINQKNMHAQQSQGTTATATRNNGDSHKEQRPQPPGTITFMSRVAHFISFVAMGDNKRAGNNIIIGEIGNFGTTINTRYLSVRLVLF